MACLLFYRPGYKKWQGFIILSALIFLHFPISAQPSPAEKLTVLLIFDTAMERTKKEKKEGRRGALHGMVNQHLIVTR